MQALCRACPVFDVPLLFVGHLIWCRTTREPGGPLGDQDQDPCRWVKHLLVRVCRACASVYENSQRITAVIVVTSKAYIFKNLRAILQFWNVSLCWSKANMTKWKGVKCQRFVLNHNILYVFFSFQDVYCLKNLSRTIMVEIITVNNHSCQLACFGRCNIFIFTSALYCFNFRWKWNKWGSLHTVCTSAFIVVFYRDQSSRLVQGKWALNCLEILEDRSW